MFLDMIQLGLNRILFRLADGETDVVDDLTLRSTQAFGEFDVLSPATGSEEEIKKNGLEFALIPTGEKKEERRGFGTLSLTHLQ